MIGVRRRRALAGALLVYVTVVLTLQIFLVSIAAEGHVHDRPNRVLILADRVLVATSIRCDVHVDDGTTYQPSSRVTLVKVGGGRTPR